VFESRLFLEKWETERRVYTPEKNTK
jgi:hypothetical protein